MSTEILTGRGESGKEFLFAFVSKFANVTRENVKKGSLRTEQSIYFYQIHYYSKQAIIYLIFSNLNRDRHIADYKLKVFAYFHTPKFKL